MPKLKSALAICLLTACSAAPQGAIDSTVPSDIASTAPVDTTPSTRPVPATPTTDPGRGSAIADAVVPLPDAIYKPPSELADPTSITIPALGVEAAPIVSVGVLENGEMEIPSVADVGWYHFGPRPGDLGSAVLAGHISFDGQPGVFRHLASLEIGDRFEVEFVDGEVLAFQVVDTAQFEKALLPTDDLFAKSGQPRVALITCGGEFDRDARSYRDNVVVIAEPIPPS